MVDFFESTGYCNPSSVHPNVLVSLPWLKVTHTVEILNQLEDSKTFLFLLLLKVTHTVELLNQLEDSKIFSSDFQTAKTPPLIPWNW